MITVDDVIAFGYFRKWYHEMKKEYLTQHAIPKDLINKIADYKKDNFVKGKLFAENKQIEVEADTYAREVIQISVDSFNKLGYNIEYIQENYKN